MMSLCSIQDTTGDQDSTAMIMSSQYYHDMLISIHANSGA